MINYQCQTCGMCMAQKFVGDHHFLSGHTKIIPRDVSEIAGDALDTINASKLVSRKYYHQVMSEVKETLTKKSKSF